MKEQKPERNRRHLIVTIKALMRLGLLFITIVVIAGPASPVRIAAGNSMGPLKPAAPDNNLAYSTRWQSRVRLGNDLSTVSASAFTVMARFFPIYRVPHFGAVLGAKGSSGDFAVGQWMTSVEQPSPKATPALGLIVGSTKKQFEVGDQLHINEWNYLAVVFKPSQGWTAYLNGTAMATVPDSGFRAKGELCAGRISQTYKHSQFYGLIDDVAVFDVALTQAQIKSHGELKALTGSETGLKWGWRFDADSDVMNAQSNAPTVEGNALKVQVSANRSSSDAQKMPDPVQANTYVLPFPADAEYYVWQGNSGNVHHWGQFAFTWDFIYAGKRSDSLAVRQKNGNAAATDAFNKKEGQGQPLTSIASGRVVDASWHHVEGDLSKIPNAVIIRHAQGEYSSYFHLQQNSFPLLFPWTKVRFTLDPSDFAMVDGGSIPAKYPAVGTGKNVGALGGTGMEACKDCFHLHFGVLDQPDLIDVFTDRISRPIHFSPFETSTDRINWKLISGIPKEGTFVRRKTPLIGPGILK